jgi:hypothetical protein
VTSSDLDDLRQRIAKSVNVTPVGLRHMWLRTGSLVRRGLRI